jgi:hypothetical protein
VHLDPSLEGNHHLATLDDIASACAHCHGVVDAPRASKTQGGAVFNARCAVRPAPRAPRVSSTVEKIRSGNKGAETMTHPGFHDRQQLEAHIVALHNEREHAERSLSFAKQPGGIRVPPDRDASEVTQQKIKERESRLAGVDDAIAEAEQILADWPAED